MKEKQTPKGLDISDRPALLEKLANSAMEKSAELEVDMGTEMLCHLKHTLQAMEGYHDQQMGAHRLTQSKVDKLLEYHE